MGTQDTIVHKGQGKLWGTSNGSVNQVKLPQAYFRGITSYSKHYTGIASLWKTKNKIEKRKITLI